MRRPLLAISLLITAGCNALAGIADYRTVDAFGGSGTGGSGGGGVDAGATGTGGADASGADAGGGTDSGGADAGLPACSAPDVALVITVVESKSGQFTGITDTKGLFSFLGIGHTFPACVPAQSTVLDLRAEPGDPSNAVHDWGACGMGRSCNMTVTAPTILDVHLQ
jgi:hypothetical protein